MDYATLKVGQEVAVGRTGSWRVMHEGIYVVSKADKLKVVLKRNSDGYERTFSVKRRCEKGCEGYYTSPFIESVDDYLKRQAKYDKERDMRDAWDKLEQAARNKSMDAVKEALGDLEMLCA